MIDSELEEIGNKVDCLRERVRQLNGEPARPGKRWRAAEFLQRRIPFGVAS
jgi:hypothetical protein